MPQRLQHWERADTITIAFTVFVGVAWSVLGFGIGAMVGGFSAPLPVLFKIVHVLVFLPVYGGYYELAALEHIIGLEQPVGVALVFVILLFNGVLIGLIPGALLVWRMK